MKLILSIKFKLWIQGQASYCGIIPSPWATAVKIVKMKFPDKPNQIYLGSIDAGGNFKYTPKIPIGFLKNRSFVFHINPTPKEADIIINERVLTNHVDPAADYKATLIKEYKKLYETYNKH